MTQDTELETDVDFRLRLQKEYPDLQTSAGLQLDMLGSIVGLTRKGGTVDGAKLFAEKIFGGTKRTKDDTNS